MKAEWGVTGFAPQLAEFSKYYWVQINPESQLSLRVCAVGMADLPAVIDR